MSRASWPTAVFLALVCGSALAVPVDLTLEPDAASGLHAGDLFTLDVWARSSPPGQGVTAVQAYITYDDTLLEVVDGSGDPAVTITPGAALPNVIRNEVLNDGLGGGIYYSAGNLSGSVPTDFLVASINFKVTAEFSDTVVSLAAGPELRNDGALSCKSMVANWIETLAGELGSAVLYGSEGQELAADPGGPYWIVLSDSVTFDGTGSIPPSDIVEYLWTLLGQEIYRGPDPTATLTWDDLVGYGVSGIGTYEVSLLVQNEAGDTALGRMTLTVTQIPEPLSLTLLGGGLVVLVRRRRKCPRRP